MLQPRPPAHGAIFGGEGPRWFTIAAHRPFLDDLAFALDAALSPLGPEALAEAVVLTPTRRAARELAEAFVRTAGQPAVLLPQIRALGDLDEGEPPFEPGELVLNLPPAISITRRRFELARLVVANERLFGRPIDTTAALELADALARFLDSLEIEELSASDHIDALVEGDLARHWQRSADFLKIATVAWPRRLDALGLMDVTERRTALLRALAEQWRGRPPMTPLIAAGSTGTAPATAELLAVIAQAPQGCVVLPGLDLGLAERAWAQVSDAHPQGALRRLLGRHGLTRDDVKPWPAPESVADANRGRARQRVVNESLRPAEATADWIKVIAALRSERTPNGGDPIAEGLDGLSVASARTEDEAATMIALLMRETLEHPTRTAALVTPDVVLARRVSAQLSRWGVQVDSSAGAPLAQFPAGRLLSSVARAAVEPLAPANLLSILKHPRVRLGLAPRALADGRRIVEKYALRGPRARDWGGLRERLALAEAPGRGGKEADGADHSRWASAQPLLSGLEAGLGILLTCFASGAAPAETAARSLAQALEALAADADGHVGGLWSGPDGEAAAELLATLLDEGKALPDCTAAGFAELIDSMSASQLVRTGVATHPRLRILGAIEARLIRADRLILGGLEEGVWPGAAETDPFLSRPMRERLGLPPPERRTGLSAHDFAQAACAAEVVLVHSERRGGQPAVMSRWLWRLETLARGAQLALPRRDELTDWARALDIALSPAPSSLAGAGRPAPRRQRSAAPRAARHRRGDLGARPLCGLRPLCAEAAGHGPAGRARSKRGRAARPSTRRSSTSAGLARPHRRPDGPWFARLLVEALEGPGVPAPPWRASRRWPKRRGLGRGVERQRRARRPPRCWWSAGAATPSTAADGSAFTVTAAPTGWSVAMPARTCSTSRPASAPSPREVESGFAPQLTLTAAILPAAGSQGWAAGARRPRLSARHRPRSAGRRESCAAEAGESATMAADAQQGCAA